MWWDPAVLTLDVREEVGLRQQRILEADESGVADAESARAHEAWQAQRAARIDAGMRPSLVAYTATRVAVESATAQGREVGLEVVDVDRATRPGGRRFGTLVHATLAVVDYAADIERIEATAHTEGRLLGCTPDEVAAAAATVRAALAHPLMRRAAAAERRRETPVIARRDDGSLVEGVVDLAFRENAPAARWTVVDFKTDREIAEHRAEHEAQVRVYVEAVEQATGETARGVLLSL